jgi:hypothetical protein
MHKLSTSLICLQLLLDISPHGALMCAVFLCLVECSEYHAPFNMCGGGKLWKLCSLRTGCGPHNDLHPGLVTNSYETKSRQIPVFNAPGLNLFSNTAANHCSRQLVIKVVLQATLRCVRFECRSLQTVFIPITVTQQYTILCPLQSRTL